MSFRTRSLIFFGLFNMVFVDLSLAVNLHELTIEDYVDYVNPPAVHKFQRNGVTILCVKFEDQISLRDEEKYWQNKISSKKGIEKSSLNNSYSGLEKCPEGTVAVPEITHEQVRHAGSVSNFLRGTKGGLAGRRRMQNLTDIESIVPAKHQYAISKHIWPNPTVAQVIAHVNVWQPLISTSNGLTSIAQVWLTTDDEHNQSWETVEVGWQVYPSKYNRDERPYFFTFWTNDGYRENFCYNLDCPGFVSTSNTTVPGVPVQSSTYNGIQMEMDINLELKDLPNVGPAWVLKIADAEVGHFPGSLFRSLNIGAQHVDVGGEVAFLDHGPQISGTQMGSGKFPEEGFGKAAYIRQLEMMDTSKRPIIQAPKQWLFATNEHCYNIKSDVEEHSGRLQRYMFFGGGGAMNPLCTS